MGRIFPRLISSILLLIFVIFYSQLKAEELIIYEGETSKKFSNIKLNKSKLQNEFKEDEIIVKFRPSYQKTLNSLSKGEGLERISMKLRNLNLKAKKLRRLGPNSDFYLIKFDKNAHTLEDFKIKLLAASEIEIAEPNYIRKLHSTIPDDFYYYDLWGLTKIGAPDAWDITKGSDSIVVAVIDSGVDYTHSDLAQNMWTNSGEIPDNGVDDDGNGYIDDFYGISPGYGPYTEGISIVDPMDTIGHGTHVAGIIGAKGNNNRGTVGLNWNVKILPCNAADPITNILWTSNTLECYSYIGNLKNRGVNIKAVNASYTGPYSYAEELSIQSNLRSKGILLIAAAGNEAQNNNLYQKYPCNYNLDNIICVASTDRNDNLSVFSNYGSSVHVAAPGQQIYSTYPITADNFSSVSWNTIFFDNF
ncbi:MAG: S8 family serine peptidase, partial [Clostridia bacterium]|nr:S8 family serine peptidase [Clostridia bacterium]